MHGITVGKHTAHTLQYADDTVLMTNNKLQSQEIRDLIVKDGKNMVFILNDRKTEVMVITKIKTSPRRQRRSKLD